jgi:hypothetical protein
MTAVKKLSDTDATGEFILPESFRLKSEELKKEQESIVEEIQKVKAEPVIRKTDESTRVFNLRQETMTAKIKELEMRRIRTEKELHAILRQKNSTLHDDLKKATLILVAETKKIAPLEKEIESGVSKISNLKNEMQQLFDSTSSEHKKNTQAIGEQAKEINQLGVIIKETLSFLDQNFRHLTSSIEQMSIEKISLASAVESLKMEIHAKQNILKNFEQKQHELAQIESKIKIMQEKLPELKEQESRAFNLREEIPLLEKEKDNLYVSIQSAIQERNEMMNGLARMEINLKQMEDQLISKRESLLSVEKEIIDAKKRLDSSRDNAFELNCQMHLDQQALARVKAEIAQFDALKASSQKLQDESFSFYQEKKEFYVRELQALEDSQKSKMAQFSAELEAKKLQWSEEFKNYTQEREKELKQKFELMEQEDLDDIRKRKNDLCLAVNEIVKKQLTREGFIAQNQKEEDAKKEVEGLFDRFFGKTNRWKLW